MILILRTCNNYVSFTWQKTFAIVIKFKDLEVEKLSCIIQVGPIYSHEALKVEGNAEKGVTVMQW